jgi:two-component system C4-dicarboxylate transport response regulator DctD
LRNAAERYALGLESTLMLRAPAGGNRAMSLTDQVEAFERAVIERCLADCGGKISEVMERLDVPRRTLSEKMARLGLDRRRYAEPDRPNSAQGAGPGGGKPPIS